MTGPLPDDFAESLLTLMEPTQVEEAGRIIGDAANNLDDDQLTDFLKGLAARIRAGGSPISAPELRALLQAARSGSPGAPPPPA